VAGPGPKTGQEVHDMKAIIYDQVSRQQLHTVDGIDGVYVSTTAHDCIIKTDATGTAHVYIHDYHDRAGIRWWRNRRLGLVMYSLWIADRDRLADIDAEPLALGQTWTAPDDIYWPATA